MKLLSKYLLRTMIRPFIITLILTNGLLLIGYCFQSLELFFTYKPGFFVILKLIASRLPENILLTLPISALMSILSLGTRLTTKGELVLVLSSGIHKKEICLPLIFFFILLSISSIFLSEFLIPQSKKSHYLLKKRISGIKIEEKPISLKLFNSFVHISSLQGNVIRDLKIQRENLIILGKICEYKNNQWHLKEGIERRIEKGEIVSEKPTEILKIKFLTPNEIKLLASEASLMKPSLLFKAILIAKRYGMECRSYIKELNVRIAFCFSSLILGIIGLGMTTRGLRFGLYGNIGIALLISFLYWEGMLFFRSLDTSPILSSWAANIIGISIALRFLF